MLDKVTYLCTWNNLALKTLKSTYLCNMAVRVVDNSNGGYKIRKIFAKNQHTQRKLLNFENWVNGELSKIGHHFRK